MSDLHETFRVFQDWSPELINNVHGHAHARMHAQRMLTCMQLRAVNKPLYFSLMKSNFNETWYVYQEDIKRMHLKKNWE